MIDINWTEVFFLAVMAVILFGPERLPEFARKAARVIAYLRRVGNDARGQLRAELGPEFDDLHLSDLNPKNFVSRHLLSEADKEDLLSIRDEFKSVGKTASEGFGDIKRGFEDVSSSSGSGSTRSDVAAEESDADDEVTGDPEFLRAIAYDPEAT